MFSVCTFLHVYVIHQSSLFYYFKRNLASLWNLIGGFSYIWNWRNWTLYQYMRNCWWIWGCRCTCWRWSYGWTIFYVPWIHPGRSFISTFWMTSIPIHIRCFHVLLLRTVLLCWLGCSRCFNFCHKLVTKAAFEKYDNGLRKGTSMSIFCIN